MIQNDYRNTGLDTSDKVTRYIGMEGAPNPESERHAETTAGVDAMRADDVMRLAQQAESQGVTYFQSAVRTSWARNYRAFRNQHFEGSKYLHARYAGRSKLFKPKTRSAVRKKMESAAKALFSTGDVVACSAQNDVDQQQKASAAIKQELVNYRLDRTSERNGIPWFLTALGAVQTSNITGIVISKQSWRFLEEEREEPEESQETDPQTGQVTIVYDDSPIIVEDRPDIELIPPENVIFDPNCDWTRPAQSSQYIRIARPMSPDEAWQLVSANQGPTKNIEFFETPYQTFLSAAAGTNGPQDASGARSARNDGRDPIQMTNGAFGRVWLYEWFMRIRGKDYTFWTLGVSNMLSKPVRVRKAYPEQRGERPLVIGYGAVEAFRTNPTSSVESWQPLQQELNDQTNLRLDQQKQGVAPPAVVKRGKNVDLKAVQARGADRVIMVDAMDDVMWPNLPQVPGSAYQDAGAISADFDDLAGVMNMGTVQTNRQLNETVGGMNLLAGDASAMADFDLSVVTETWIEPVIRQLVRLEETYESDETVLQIAGERAQLFQRFGISEITDKLLEAETTLSVKIGVGASNLPMQRIQKMQAAAQTCMQMLMPFVQAGVLKPPTPNAKEIIDEVFGAAGFKDGGERFFVGLDQMQQQQSQQPGDDPHTRQAAMEQDANRQKLMLEGQKLQVTSQLKTQELQSRERQNQQKLWNDAQNRQAKAQSDRARLMGELGRASLMNAHGRAAQAADHAHNLYNAAADRQHQANMARQDGGMQALLASLNQGQGAPGAAGQQMMQ